LLNGFMPRFTFEEKSYSAITQALVSQSAVFHYFSLSVIPLKIINELFKEQNSLTPHRGKMPEPEKSSRNANSSSDYSIVSFDKKVNPNRTELQRVREMQGTVFVSIEPRLQLLIPLLENTSAGADTVMALVMLMFFFLLPRSSVGDYAIKFSRVRP
jgi:hypothetical protein